MGSQITSLDIWGISRDLNEKDAILEIFLRQESYMCVCVCVCVCVCLCVYVSTYLFS